MALRFPGWGMGEVDSGSNRVGPPQLPEVPGTFVCRELREDPIGVRCSMFSKVLHGKSVN
jgi:hypothetical protein